MLSANKEKLQSFLSGHNQYIIPFFQRSYVWKSENWYELWESIKEEYEAFKRGEEKSEHFIGTIIIKQCQSKRLGIMEFDLIDGQQRLTTICLLLRAIHDLSDDTNICNWAHGFLVFMDSYGAEHIRIVHSKVDREYFHAIILDKDKNNALWEIYAGLKQEEFDRRIETENNIKGAYLYFRRKIQQEAANEDLRGYISIILNKLPVIHMALAAEDDVQQIFDTINSLGVKLTTAELLKNLLYSKKAVIEKYDEYWSNIFEADEDAIEFWNRERSSGRVRRTTVELFLYSYLVILVEGSVRMERLFKEYKSYLDGKTDPELLAFALELKEFAEVYQDLPDGENLSEISFVEHEKRFFHIVREFEITTVFPLVLYIYKKVTDPTERIKILRVLESYLTRRTICKFTTKNYNNLFLSLLGAVKRMERISADAIKEELLRFTEPTNKFPDDEEMQHAFKSHSLTNKYSREILYCIALYQLNTEFADNPRLNFNGFSTEHIMPKKWRNHWHNMPEDGNPGHRDFKLLTLGNLTLVKGKLNSSMRDANWGTKKKALLRYSTLRQTTDYLALDDWNESHISTRADDLFLIACQIWKR